MFIKASKFIFYAGLTFLITACGEKFDKTKWTDFGELGGSGKVSMAEDLIKTHRLIGLNYAQMIQLLGEPANYADTDKTYYRLSEKYDMIDPVSGKDLAIKFSKDSVIVDAKIDEWHKN